MLQKPAELKGSGLTKGPNKMEILGFEPRTLRLKDKYSNLLSYTS